MILDVRNSNLAQIINLKKELLEASGTQADLILLGNWNDLRLRYSPVSDQYLQLREIYNWLKGDSQYRFAHIDAESNLRIEDILEFFTLSSTPIHIFAEAEGNMNLKDLSDYLKSSELGLIGLANLS